MVVDVGNHWQVIKMMERLDRYVKAIWAEYKLVGFIAIAVVLLIAAYVFGVDLGGYVNRLLGL